MIAGMAALLVVGTAAITDTQDQITTSRAETSMTQLDAQAAMVALGNSKSQLVELPGGGGKEYEVRNDSGTVSITYVNRTSGATEDIVSGLTMGSIVFENGGDAVAYQGGGVWRERDNHSRMVSPPEFHYRNGTLTFPLVTVQGDEKLSNRVSIVRNDTTRFYPNTDRNPDFTNPFDQGKVTVTVQSDYYRGWGEYFETRTGGSVDYDHDDNSVSMDLVVPAKTPPVTGGIVTAPSDGLTIKEHAEADSYNSSTGPYGTFPDGENTKIIANGDVTIRGHATLHGDLEADGEVEIENHGEITGNVSHQGLDVAAHGSITGWEEENASVTPPSAVDREIDSRLDSYRDDNDNANASVDIDESSDALENCASTCTVINGTYYLEEIDLTSDETLEFNTSGGDVHLAVNGTIDVDGESPETDDPEIEIVGDGRVNLYVADDVTFSQHGSANVTGDRAPLFWTFVKSTSEVTFDNHARYQGVVYGPGPGNLPGANVTVDNHASVFGGIVGNVNFVSNQYSIHYDEAVASVETIEVDESVPGIAYLHVTSNNVTVTSPE